MIIRKEEPTDIPSIREITSAAFENIEHSSRTEAAIIDALRKAGAVTLSLVAIDGGELVGHIAFSPVTVDDRDIGWHGLGPIAVRPDRQDQGIGSSLVREGLEKLRTLGARGCVLLGEPEYYHRFGFKADPALLLAGGPPEYFLVLPFGAEIPHGTIRYHQAFEATNETNDA